MKFFFAITFVIFFLTECKPPRDRINGLIHSNGACDRIKGYELIGQYKDTAYLEELFKDLNDIQICLSLGRYGKSPLWAKVKALERITNVKLPYEYDTFTLDTTALTFYKRVLVAKGYILH
jgi:hypothetical protein